MKKALWILCLLLFATGCKKAKRSPQANTDPMLVGKQSTSAMGTGMSQPGPAAMAPAMRPAPMQPRPMKPAKPVVRCPQKTELPRLLCEVADDSRYGQLKKIEAGLVRIGKPAIPGLIKLLGGQSRAVRGRVARVLGRMGKPAFAAIKRAFNDQRRPLRVGAAAALAYHGKKAVPLLIKALGARGWGLPREAATSLEYLGRAAKAAVPALRARLERTNFACEQTARALKKISPGHPEPALVERCVSFCGSQSRRCSAATSRCRKAGRGRCYGLRRCGCAFVTCRQRCRKMAYALFACR